uniref:Bcl-2-like protein 11 n=1 Tax=Acrobeloides nanus TaxID=290746 RepID=A0A914DS30_9BILA
MSSKNQDDEKRSNVEVGLRHGTQSDGNKSNERQATNSSSVPQAASSPSVPQAASFSSDANLCCSVVDITELEILFRATPRANAVEPAQVTEEPRSRSLRPLAFEVGRNLINQLFGHLNPANYEIELHMRWRNPTVLTSATLVALVSLLLLGIAIIRRPK